MEPINTLSPAHAHNAAVALVQMYSAVIADQQRQIDLLKAAVAEQKRQLALMEERARPTGEPAK